MILSTSMSQPTVPKLLDPPPGMMTSEFGAANFPHSPLDEADQMCSMFVNDYTAPDSPGAILGLMDDFRMDSPNKDIWKLLPTPPRSPDHYHYGYSSNIPTVPVECGNNGMMSSPGALGQAWAGLGFDEWGGPLEDPPEVPSEEDQEAICAILFEHDDFIDRLLKDDSVLDSVLGGSVGSDEITEVDTMVAVEDWSSPTSPAQPVVKSELLHDCMWSGQCTDDCKQKAAREKRQALVATPTSSFDVVVSPESAMPPPSPDVLVANPLFSPSRIVVGATSSRTSMVDDESAATQCVDPSSVLGYTPLSDHSYHQATTSAPPTPPDSPRAVTQQGSSSVGGAGAGNGSTSSPPLLVVRRRNGVWKREVVMSDTPSESDEDDDEDDDDEDEEADEDPQPVVAEEQQRPDEEDDEEDDDDDDEDDDEEIDVVTVSGERHHGGRHGAAAPAVVALPANGSVNAIRCPGRLPRVIVNGVSSAPPSPAVVSRMTSSGRVVTPSHKALTNGQTQRRRRRRGAELATSASSVAGGKRKRSRHHHHHHHHHHGSTPSSPQSKRSRRDEDSSSSSSSSSSSQSASRRGGHHSLSQLPPSAKRNEHNTMERKRRDDLRVAFQELREKVPSLADNKKAAKVTILNEAANYALQLAYDLLRNDREKKQEEQRHQMLKRRLAMLQQQQRARHPYRR